MRVEILDAVRATACVSRAARMRRGRNSRSGWYPGASLNYLIASLALCKNWAWAPVRRVAGVPSAVCSFLACMLRLLSPRCLTEWPCHWRSLLFTLFPGLFLSFSLLRLCREPSKNAADAPFGPLWERKMDQREVYWGQGIWTRVWFWDSHHQPAHLDRSFKCSFPSQESESSVFQRHPQL